MSTPTQEPLLLKESDRDFITTVAQRILGENSVAATTASRLVAIGIDARRIDSLIPWYGGPIEVGDFVVKKIEPDTESPGNFGLFLRRRKTASD